jgi:phosphate transport system substrate-binding protein
MKKLAFYLPIVFFVFLAVTSKGCSCIEQFTEMNQQQFERETATKGSLNILTDYSLTPIIEKQTQEFMRLYPESELKVSELNARKAVEGFLNQDGRSVVFGYKLTPVEDSVIAELNLQLKKSLVGRDAVCVLAHSSNPVKTISVGQFKAILTGEITNWQTLNGPTIPIRVFTTSVNDTRYSYLQDSLRIPGFSSTAYPCTSASQMKEMIGQFPGALGLGSISNFREVTDPDARLDTLNFKLLALSADSLGAKAYYPYQKQVHEGFYPLTYGIYHMFDEYERLPRGFGAFLSREGQKIFVRNGVAPVKNPVRVIYFKQDE